MSRSLVIGRIGGGGEELGGRHRHRMGRRYDCINIGPPVLYTVSCKFCKVTPTLLHLLKLVTGVDISTRAVRRSGRPGKPVKSSRRTAAAAPKSAAFLLSIFMADMIVGTKMKNNVPQLQEGLLLSLKLQVKSCLCARSLGLAAG